MDDERRLALAREAAMAGGELAREGFRGEFAVETKDGPLDHVTDHDHAVQEAVVGHLRGADPDAVVVAEEDVPGVDVAETVPEEGRAWVVDPIDGTTNFAMGSRVWAVSVAAVEDREPVAAVNHLPALGDTYVAGSGAGNSDGAGSGDGVGNGDGDGDRDGDGGDVVDGEGPPTHGQPATRNGEPISVGDKTDPETFATNPIFGVDRRDRERLSEFVATITGTFGDVRRYGSAQYVLSAVASGELDAAVSDVRLNPWDSVSGVHIVRRAGGTVTDIHGDRWTPGSRGLIATNGRAHEAVVGAFDAR